MKFIEVKTHEDDTILDNHRYPTRIKDGGEATIVLCPNCHRKFHEITDHRRNVSINREVIDNG